MGNLETHMVRDIFVVVFITLAMVLAGCDEKDKDTLKQAMDLGLVKIVDGTYVIDKEALAIYQQAVAIPDKKSGQAIMDSVQVIQETSGEIRVTAQQFEAISAQVGTLERENVNLRAAVKQQEAQVISLKETNRRLAESRFGLLVTLGAVATAVSVALFFLPFTDKRIAVSVGSGGIVLTAIGFAVIRYLPAVEIVGLAILAVVAVGGVVLAVAETKLLAKVAVYTARLVERIKNMMKSSEREKVFGSEQEIGIAKMMLPDATTAATVKAIRLSDDEIQKLRDERHAREEAKARSEEMVKVVQEVNKATPKAGA